MTEELTRHDKAELLGVMDGKGLAKESYDHEFYKAMYRIAPLELDEVDDQVRRAIIRFVMDTKTINPDNGGLVIMGFVHGYMVGRKLRKDIRGKR